MADTVNNPKVSVSISGKDNNKAHVFIPFAESDIEIIFQLKESLPVGKDRQALFQEAWGLVRTAIMEAPISSLK